MLRYGIEKFRHHQVIAYLTAGEKIGRVMGCTTVFLECLHATDIEYGYLKSIVLYEQGRRTLMGPLVYPANVSKNIMDDIVGWIQTSFERKIAITDFFTRLINDLELCDKEKNLLCVRLQKERWKKFPIFKWRSEVRRQLKNKEKIQARILYNWARQGDEIE